MNTGMCCGNGSGFGDDGDIGDDDGDGGDDDDGGDDGDDDDIKSFRFILTVVWAVFEVIVAHPI